MGPAVAIWAGMVQIARCPTPALAIAVDMGCALLETVHVIPNGRALTAVMRHTARGSWRNSVSIVPDMVYALAEIAHATCNGVGLIVAFRDV